MWIKVGLSGGCHWCTEAVFQSLVGTRDIQQGWLSSTPPNENFAEGVLLEFDSETLPLSILLSAHLSTHQSQKNHSRRNTYRSAVYYFSPEQKQLIRATIKEIEESSQSRFITEVLPFQGFKESREANSKLFLKKTPEKPFCRQYISPKLAKLRASFLPYFKEM
jgi:Peptide methionine sulfoxide reductase